MTPRNSTMQQGRPVHMPPQSDVELEAQAIAELERMSRALDRKKRENTPRRRRKYADHR